MKAEQTREMGCRGSAESSGSASEEKENERSEENCLEIRQKSHFKIQL